MNAPASVEAIAVTAVERDDTKLAVCAAAIEAAYGRSVTAILDLAEVLIASRREFAHGDWGRMFSCHPDRIPGHVRFSAATARKLMAIGEHPVLSNRSRGNVLPAAWTVLYELSLIPADRLEELIQTGRVGPETTRDCAASFTAPPPPALVPPKEFTRLPQRLEVDYCCPRCCYGWSGNPRPAPNRSGSEAE